MAQIATEQATKTSPSSRQRTRGGWRRYRHRTFFFFVAPWLFGFIGLTIIPFAFALIMSFTSFDGVSAGRWVGLRNYTDLLHDPDTLFSLGRTLLYAVVAIPLSIVGGLGLALLVNRRFPAIGLFRAIFYLPSVMPIVATAIVWRSVFARDTGLLNALVERLGGPTITWLIDPIAFWAVIIMVLWGMGGGMLISLAGLQGIPSELKEAARIDGAGSWHILRSIILPLISPVLFFQVIMGCIGSFQVLIQPLLLASGSLSNIGFIPRGNYFYMVHVYEQFFFFQRFGYGSALLWVLFLLILLVTLLIFRSGFAWVYYEVDR